MDFEDKLREKLARAVRDMIKPPVLFGPKWLRRRPKAKAGDFEFLGVPKIAKATGKSTKRIAEMLLKRLEPEKMGLTVKVGADGLVIISKAKQAGKATPAAEKPPES